MQIDSFISSAIGFATINAGRAKFNGMEADFTAQVTPSDRINAAVNFLDAKFTRFSTFATGLSGGAPILDFSGNQPANAPKWTVALGYEHAFDLVEAGSLTASIFSRYKSKYYLGTSNFAAQLQEAHTQTDVSLTYDSVDGRYSVQGYVRNLENYVPVTFASFTGGPPINIFNFIFGAPRTYGVEARYHF
jgi:iron complex outermembrane receptor protein